MKKISKRNIRCYNEQYWYGESFIKDFINISDDVQYNILEVGTAEGGLLKYFAEKKNKCFGIEYSENRYESAMQLNSDFDIKFYHGDITDLSEELQKLFGKIDIVICRDVIEHIPSELKEKAVENMCHFLKPGGKMFVSFPPKYSPYAGHQQVVKNPLGKLPFLHYLPSKVYSTYLSILKTNKLQISNLLDIKHCRLTISSFETIANSTGLKIEKEELYIIRPCYESRFNMKKRKHNFQKSSFRELITLGAIFLLEK